MITIALSIRKVYLQEKSDLLKETRQL